MWTRRLSFRTKVLVFMTPLLLPVGGAGLDRDAPAVSRPGTDLRPVSATSLGLPQAQAASTQPEDDR